MEALQPPMQTRMLLLLGGMLAAVGLVAGLAYLDEAREARAALADLAHEQQLLAQSEANELSVRLQTHGGKVDPDLLVHELAESSARVDPLNATVVLLQVPGETEFRTLEGRKLTLPWIHFSQEEGTSSARLTPAEAAALGLPVRMTVAGLASAERWGVVVVASAARERDRERRAQWRLFLAIIIAAGASLSFGGFALRQERRQAGLARALQNAEREDHLRQLERAVATITFASGIAHELSTPLSVIAGRAEQLASRASGDERTSQVVATILDQTERISQVLRGFLHMARGGNPRLESVEAGWIVTEARSLVEHRFNAAGVSLATAVPSDLPPLRGDALLLEHALVNLLLNACDACPRGGRVEVTVAVDGDGLAFTVTDDGQGIPPEVASRLLEPFFTTKAPGQGTGLGLAIVNEIVKSHHGSLVIDPHLPRGTRVRFRIPFAARQEASDAA